MYLLLFPVKQEELVESCNYSVAMYGWNKDSLVWESLSENQFISVLGVYHVYDFY